MANKRTYELIEKLTTFAGFFFLADKLGETEANKVSFETLNSELVHDDMSSVLQAGTGVQDGHISDQAQTLFGIKTFNSSPIVPTPLLDTEAANKEYVDNATPAIELPNKTYIYATTLYEVSDNVLEESLNQAPWTSDYTGTITRIEFTIDIGSNPSIDGLQINFTVDGLDLLATDYPVVDGLNVITTIQNAAISQRDEIKIPVRNSSGARDVGGTVVKLFVTI